MEDEPLIRVALGFALGIAGISCAAIFVRLALPAPPLVTALYRLAIASALIFVWLGLRRRRLRLPPRAVLGALAAGACFGADLALWHTAIVHTSVANATLLVNTTPVYVGLFAVLFQRERLGPRFPLGVGLAFLGSGVLLGADFESAEQLRGDGLSLLAALFYSGYLLLVKALRRTADALPVVAVAGIGGTALLAVGVGVRGDPLSGFPAASWLAIVGAALVSHLGGVLGIVWALRYLRASFAAVALLAQPLGTALLGWMVLGEAVGALQGLGGLAVLAGIALAYRPAASAGPSSPPS